MKEGGMRYSYHLLSFSHLYHQATWVVKPPLPSSHMKHKKKPPYVTTKKKIPRDPLAPVSETDQALFRMRGARGDLHKLAIRI
jgi:hypothetical protein